MRRMLLLAVGLLALALAAPTVAGAHGRHHRHHHHKHHKAHGADLSGRAAGTIASFDGTTLTLTLANGSTVSGVVTDDTDIDLIEAAPAAVVSHHGDDDQGDDDGRWWGHNRSCGSDDGDTSDLVAGATVWKASLELGPDGAVFEQVKLLVPQQSDS
jgi:hypothetical protein